MGFFLFNNFSGIKSELSIVSIVKLYKVTPVHLGYHFQYLQYSLQLQAGTKSALFCDEKCPFL